MPKNTYSLVLASQSPRRKELIKSLFIPFKVEPANIDETSRFDEPSKLVEDLSFQKAQAVLSNCSSPSIVVGSDTIVYFEGEVLGKPNTRDEAGAILKRLSGKQHEVYSGVCICTEGMSKTFSVKTKVYFREIPDDLLELYLDTEESMDKAGAYGIQAHALAFIERIEGSYSNVVGLPVDSLLIALQEFLQKLEPSKSEWRSCFVS
ncbi:MAG: septum formation protein Maf [Halobacteriovoraceae bacterium]|nr:septum formation protein Maf [Halobacteriovoraceae bacterium]|tara:strand:- start:2716 stop:3333 length:618 start_codon:yes stop_codon:yes gene_type:complete